MVVAEVPPHELHPLRTDHGFYPGPHEFSVPFVQRLAGVTRERGELEFEGLADVERAFLVLAEETVVLRLVFGAIEHAALDEELRPFVVAVSREQRVVEIEERQFQVPVLARQRRAASSRPSASLSSGSVIGRLRCSVLSRSKSASSKSLSLR